MKVTIQDLKERIANLDWDINKIADSFSAIGHETEVVGDDMLDITLTTNRADCKDINVLAFDFAGVNGLEFSGEKPDTTISKTINVSIDDANKILGTELIQTDLDKLKQLGFSVEANTVGVPAYRTDIAEKADIAEEAARTFGYQNITPKPLTDAPVVASDDYYRKLHVKVALAEQGLTETLNYSFVSEKNDWQLDHPYNDDEPYLRNSLLYGLLKTIAKNPFIKRGGFFEVGQVYLHEELEYIGVVIFGYKNNAREEMIAAAEKALCSKEKVEIIQIDQPTLDKYEVKQSNVYFFEVPTSALEASTEAFTLNYDLPVIKPISKFPPTVRDFTIINIDASKAAEIIEKSIETFKELVVVEKVDEYTNKDTHETSVTIRFILQKMEESFTESEIEELSQSIADFLKPYGRV